MTKFWVVGGEFADTSFKTLIDGGQPHRHGPFANYEAAKKEWQARAWASVDSALSRYWIEEDPEDQSAMAVAFWVVGGEYADTGFASMADGQPERRFGPFKTYEDAKKEWQARAWASVDDAMTRYRIDKIAMPPAKEKSA